MYILDNKTYQCGECLKKYRERKDAEEMLKKYRTNMGCFTNDSPLKRVVNDIEYSTCPGNTFNFQVYYVIQLYRKYQDGILPYPGSLTEQPAKVMEAFSVIDDYNNTKLLNEKKKKDLHRGNHRPGTTNRL